MSLKEPPFVPDTFNVPVYKGLDSRFRGNDIIGQSALIN
jgi:hypothetical protein